MTERVSDAQLRKMSLQIGLGAQAGNGPSQVLHSMASELLALRQLARDVAAHQPDPACCPWCHGYRSIGPDGFIEPIRHLHACPIARAVELTQEVPTAAVTLSPEESYAIHAEVQAKCVHTALCVGSDEPVKATSRVIMSVSVTITTSVCPYCSRRVLVVRGRRVAHPEWTAE